MSNQKLKGLHHVTAITSDAEKIYAFFTKILGMRLVKKNVNQDDWDTYHLFFADDRGNAGTDMTFFDFKGIGPHQKGTEDIDRVSFRVPSDAALAYWEKRFAHYGVVHQQTQTLFGRKFLYFEDFDQQAYALVSDEGVEGVAAGEAWHASSVPDQFGIVGLGPIFLRISRLDIMEAILVNLFQMRQAGTTGAFHLYEMAEGGNGGSVIVEIDQDSPVGRQGYGGVHHVAFRVEDLAAIEAWEERLTNLQLPNSGFVERFYFKSLYTNLYPNILFELATDGPGFIDDQEDYETLGETLTLPPRIRPYREQIEASLQPFPSIWPGAEKETSFDEG